MPHLPVAENKKAFATAGLRFKSSYKIHVLRLLEKGCAVTNRSIEYFISGLGFSMSILVAVQVFCRYVLNSSLFWSEELARYMLVWISFFGATVAYYRNLHPGVDVLSPAPFPETAWERSAEGAFPFWPSCLLTC